MSRTFLNEFNCFFSFFAKNGEEKRFCPVQTLNFIILFLSFSLSLVLRLGREECAFCVHRMCECVVSCVAYEV